MRVFAISDLHLSFTSNKPMDKFGPHWYRHHEKIEQAWRAGVREEDVVLIPGDHSWALKLADALPDLQWIAALPGTKIMGKGNHDLWWQSLAKLDGLALHQTRWLQNNAYVMGTVGICGTRGWALPGIEPEEHDEKVYRRELERLKLSINELERLKSKAQPAVQTVICMLHYPPILSDRRKTEFTEIVESSNIDICIHGHMHQSHARRLFQGQKNGVQYRAVSCDLTGFAPLLLCEGE